MDTAILPPFRSLLSALLAASLWALPALSAQAEEGWGGQFGLSSDYVYRGVSLSNNKPSLQVDVHYHGDGDWFAGLGSASAEHATDDYLTATADAYIGWRWTLEEDWSGGVSIKHYDYVGGDQPSLYRYDELGASLNWRHNVFLAVAASPDVGAQTYSTDIVYYQGQAHVEHYLSGNRRGAGYTYELVLNQELPWSPFSFNAGLGYRDLKNLENVGYAYGSAGLAWNRGPWVLNLSRIASNHAADRLCCGSPAVNRWVASAVWRF